MYKAILKAIGKSGVDNLSDFRQARYSLARKSYEKIREEISIAYERNAHVTSELRTEVDSWKRYFQNLVERNATLDQIIAKLETISQNMQRHKRNLDILPHAYFEINEVLDYERTKLINQIGEWEIWGHLKEQTQRLSAATTIEHEALSEEREASAKPFDHINEDYQEQFRGPNNNQGPS